MGLIELDSGAKITFPFTATTFLPYIFPKYSPYLVPEQRGRINHLKFAIMLRGLLQKETSTIEQIFLRELSVKNRKIRINLRKLKLAEKEKSRMRVELDFLKSRVQALESKVLQLNVERMLSKELNKEEMLSKELGKETILSKELDNDEEWTPNYREKQEEEVEEEEFGNHSHHGLRKHPCKECANCLVKDCRKCVFCRFGFHISLVGFLQLFSPQRQGQIWWTQCQEAALHLQREVLEASGDYFLKKNF